MEIVWYGHACCALDDGNTTLVTDPYDESLGLKLPPLQGSIVTVSHNNPRHNAAHRVKDVRKVIQGPGEYEMQGIFVTGKILYPPKAKASNKATADMRNIVFVFAIDEINVCHLGDISHVPSQSQMEDLDNIDVLLIPIGGGRGLNAAKASELISLIEPAIVVPIHYGLPGISVQLDSLDKFLKEMGQVQREPIDRLRIKRSTLPLETQIVVLTPQIDED